jgi:hypothetical protein
MRRLLAALLFVSVATSCDTFDPLIENTVTGTWRGESAGQTFLVVMQQAGSTVAGTGTITSAAAGTRNLSISGTFTQPSFSGTLTPVGASAITLVGTVEGRSLVGTLTGGGFNGDGLALMRD